MEKLGSILLKRVIEMLLGIAKDFETLVGAMSYDPGAGMKTGKPPAAPGPPADTAPPTPPTGPPADTAPPTPPTGPPATPPAAVGVDLDTAGLPWDARIHAKTKTKVVKGGTWKRKRNVEDTLVASVEAELRAVLGAAPPAAAAPGPPAAAAAGAITTFPELVARVTGAGLDAATITSVCQAQGVESFALLGTRPDLIPMIAASLFPGG